MINLTPHRLKQLISCVEREISFRRVVYPKRIALSKMTRLQAENEILAMQEVLLTLNLVERNKLYHKFNQESEEQ